MADRKPPGRPAIPHGGKSPPAVRPWRAIGAVPEPPAYERLRIDSHRQLALKQAEICGRLERNPEIAKLCLLNPALAFKDVGVHLSPELIDHVLRAVRHAPTVRKRRNLLEEKLTAALGEPPQPADPAWVSRVLFEKLGLEPLEIGGRKPPYVPAIDPGMLDRLRRLLPTMRRLDVTALPHAPKLTTVRLAPTIPAARRMDLTATPPALPRAGTRPREVTLEDLWFYKDRNPIAHQLLELGAIQRAAGAVHSADSYRRIKAGEKRSAVRSWITEVRFPRRRGR